MKRCRISVTPMTLGKSGERLKLLFISDGRYKWSKWRERPKRDEGRGGGIKRERTEAQGTRAILVRTDPLQKPESQASPYKIYNNTYSEATTGKASPKCQAIPCDQFEVVIHQNYDPLLCHRLHIMGEVQLLVHHCLLALLRVKKEYLSRCELTLNKMGLNVVQEAQDDMVGVAEFVATNNLRDTTAIASARAAELTGWRCWRTGYRTTQPIIPWMDRPFKTSIVFAHDKGTSMLFKVLSAFAFWYISLTKIESRPHRNCPIRLVDDANVRTTKHFEYMFYVDFEASMAEVRAQNALAEVQKVSPLFFRSSLSSSIFLFFYFFIFAIFIRFLLVYRIGNSNF
uniref:Prephenate dehydratase domain-containing protein n=1 Tax=Nelumbo nucifera TaxID=4432 RepID=A0A822YHY9_NELNU|nr:TPA_asm: hypothetical protein HUJ06_009456 [Nelumbo nucifera]